MSPQNSRPGICEDPRCDNPGDRSRVVWYCTACSSCFCDKCWDFSPIHMTARHEKLAYIDFLRCNRLKEILKQPANQSELEKLHDRDTNTTWFGIDRYEDGRPFLQDFETFAFLMANCPGAYHIKYPQLVSFVGETSAGKSTLVKMLIDHEESKNDANMKSSFPSPVAGSAINDSTPTSADVHLYADPATWEHERPIFYADCEGLNAGERIPIGAHSRRIARLDNSKRLGYKVRRLEWANSDDTKTRQYAVTQLYPRLLYTFSDVVVFVLRTAKTFESVLAKLLDWASASLEASTNQGTLPHAVIALNCTDMNIDPALWEVGKATTSLLQGNSHLIESVNGSYKFQKLADKWRRKGKRIHSVRDLIHCYYSSFQVVRIPDGQNLPLLSRQISHLHDTIVGRCEAAYLSKKKARLLSSGDDFTFYIQQAFGHFSRNLDQPFDFKEYSLRRNPIPQDLGDHILRIAHSIQEMFPDAEGPWIFDKLSFLVASCVLYDCVTYRKGLPHHLLGDYLPKLEKTLVEFCSMYWPCGFRNNKGRCVNVSKLHSKGHQNMKGKVLATGQYVSNFTATIYKLTWTEALKNRLAKLQEELKEVEEAGAELEDPLIAVRKKHMENITRFFVDVGGASRYISHATCLCCLMRPPEHALRCGHVLCSSCVKRFGEDKKTAIEMRFCPLHAFEDPKNIWEPPWKIRMKPDFAGIRVLSLDGGGIRGITELEVLRQIQSKLGVNIPIQAFFDLIVGTSTGGIIALALGVKQWPVDMCIREFKRLCNKAFTPREFHGVWGLRHVATAHHGSVWTTTPLHDALKESLGRRSMFGGAQHSDASYAARVAVTTTNDIATKGIVIANYCRQGGERNYEFLRPKIPQDEMELWEAGAATAAAVPYFKPFVHDKTDTTYLDGAFHNNNPVKVGYLERQLLWADVQNKPPDLFLSIGTSQDQKQVQRELIRREPPKSKPRDLDQDQSVNLKASKRWRHFVGITQVGKAAYNRLTSMINCERQWGDFLENTVRQRDREEIHRYVRLNPDIRREPPPLDARDEVEKLQADVALSLETYESQLQLEEVVFRLIASSFYFEREHVTRNRSRGTATVSGKLQCRFEKSSEWLKQLGLFFEKQQRIDFQPYFDIWDGLQQHAKQKILLTERIIRRMTSHGDFNIEKNDITVATIERNADIQLHFFTSSSRSRGYSISGFPRDFLTEDDWTSSGVSDESDEENESNDKSHGLSRARTHRAISTAKDLETREKTKMSWMRRAVSVSHLRSASENNLSTKSQDFNEDLRRKSEEMYGSPITKNQDSRRPSSTGNLPPLQTGHIQPEVPRDSNGQSRSLLQPLENAEPPTIVVSPVDMEDRSGLVPQPLHVPNSSSIRVNPEIPNRSDSRFDNRNSTYSLPAYNSHPRPTAVTHSEVPGRPVQHNSFISYQYPNQGYPSSNTAHVYEPQISYADSISGRTLQSSNSSIPSYMSSHGTNNVMSNTDADDEFQRELEMAKQASLQDLEKMSEDEQVKWVLENSKREQ